MQNTIKTMNSRNRFYDIHRIQHLIRKQDQTKYWKAIKSCLAICLENQAKKIRC